VVLDTHAWIWWVDDPRRLSAAARAAISEAPRRLVSAVSCLEVATLARRRRIELDRSPGDWVAAALGRPAVEASAVTPEIAVAAGSLPDDFPGDRADRIIYATAIATGATLVTRDDTIGRFDRRRTVW